MHASWLQREEASAETVEGRRHCGDDVRGNAYPSNPEAERQLRRHPQPDADLRQLLSSSFLAIYQEQQIFRQMMF